MCVSFVDGFWGGAGACRGWKEVSNYLKLARVTGVNPLIWVLRTELRSSARPEPSPDC